MAVRWAVPLEYKRQQVPHELPSYKPTHTESIPLELPGILVTGTDLLSESLTGNFSIISDKKQQVQAGAYSTKQINKPA